MFLKDLPKDKKIPDIEIAIPLQSISERKVW